MKPSELLRLVWINITQNKFKTIIGNNVFVGSDTQLVAPVTVAVRRMWQTSLKT